jgi:excisionase family DNA binding protein
LDRDVLMTPAEAARLVEVTPARIRQMVDSGRLSAIRTGAGWRLLKRSDVERLARERAAKLAKGRS